MLPKRNHRKAIGPHHTPVQVGRCMGELSSPLTRLYNVIFIIAKIQGARLGTLIPLNKKRVILTATTLQRDEINHYETF